MQQTKKVAIIGSGISGLACAHILDKRYQITLFEANDYFGGHANTICVENDHETLAIDTGFIVFNQRNYPLFTRILKEINVAHQASEMSFSFASAQHNLEYNGHNLKTLFAQKRNLLRPRFYRLIKNILRFQHDALEFLEHSTNNQLSLKDFVAQQKYDPWLWETYLQPMVAAIWSSSAQTVKTMSAKFILEFFNHHGLLRIQEAPQWLTIKGGSQEYVRALLQRLQANKFKNAKVSKVVRHQQGAKIYVGAELYEFDHVILACHSNTALKILDKPTDAEEKILSAISYQSNEVVLHTDQRIMPKHKSAWASWNYRQASNTELSTLTYYMNRLQNLPCQQDYFVTVNLNNSIDPQKIIREFKYEHPVLNQKAMLAQSEFGAINNFNNTSFCGAYWFNGFHEDGVTSAARVCAQLGVTF